MSSSSTEGNLDAESLLRAYEQFDTLLADYKKSRQVWQQEADDDLFSIVRSMEETERAASAKLKRIERMLADFTTHLEQDYEEHIRSRRTQATTVQMRTGIQMEILRLLEMSALLPEDLWDAETHVLEQLGEMLSRSQTDCRIDDYVALQKASLRILERVFRSILSNSVHNV